MNWFRTHLSAAEEEAILRERGVRAHDELQAAAQEHSDAAIRSAQKADDATAEAHRSRQRSEDVKRAIELLLRRIEGTRPRDPTP